MPNTVPTYGKDTPAGKALPRWRRCSDCGAKVLPILHEAYDPALHDGDCKYRQWVPRKPTAIRPETEGSVPVA